MRWRIPTLALSALILACGPGEEPVVTEPSTDAVLQPATAKASRSVLTANLSGRQEVPAVDTRARGQAVFRVTDGGEAIAFRLIVANIEDLLMAHIHVEAVGVNGPIAVWLYPPGPPPELIPGQFSGVLATGTITADNLVGPLAEMTIADLLAEMRAGNTYVNVHTQANMGGEIRGQIR